MVEQVKHKNEILALIIRNSFKKEGIKFFTPNDYSLQVGYMNRPKEYSIKPHIHYLIPRTVNALQEVLFIKKGKLRVDFYDNKKNYLFSEILFTGDFIVLISAGHGFFMLEDSEIIEVKQGPYMEDKDKEKFDPVGLEEIIFDRE
tara:strand:- start:60 stop:494 length:435 start_codon:yes stop_codon:yes gene_type:complete